MSQRNTIIGYIANIRVNENNNWVLQDSVTGMKEGTKVFLSIADRYWSAKLQNFETRFIPFQAFIPEGMTIRKGQLVAADFIVNPYIDNEGYTSIAFDIINFDFSLSMGSSGSSVDPDRGMRVAGGQFNDGADNSMNNNAVNNSVNGNINDNMNNTIQGESPDDGFRDIPGEIDEELPFN